MRVLEGMDVAPGLVSRTGCYLAMEKTGWSAQGSAENAPHSSQNPVRGEEELLLCEAIAVLGRTWKDCRRMESGRNTEHDLRHFDTHIDRAIYRL
jgi:hypothetical protein